MPCSFPRSHVGKEKENGPVNAGKRFLDRFDAALRPNGALLKWFAWGVAGGLGVQRTEIGCCGSAGAGCRET